jgi:predicted nucleic acid-binding protein
VRQLQYYIDTSVWNFLLETGRPDERALTEQFFRQLTGLGRAMISDVVLEEIGRAPATRREALLRLIAQHAPSQLRLDEEAKELAKQYVHAGLIPARYRNDALHLALAVVHECNAVVSWNFEHMVKLKTRLGVNGLNKMLGYREIEIVSPQEVIEP